MASTMGSGLYQDDGFGFARSFMHTLQLGH